MEEGRTESSTQLNSGHVMEYFLAVISNSHSQYFAVERERNKSKGVANFKRHTQHESQRTNERTTTHDKHRDAGRDRKTNQPTN